MVNRGKIRDKYRDNKSYLYSSTRIEAKITSCTFSVFDPTEPRLNDLRPCAEIGSVTEKRFSSSDMSISGALVKIIKKKLKFKIPELCVTIKLSQICNFFTAL